MKELGHLKNPIDIISRFWREATSVDFASWRGAELQAIHSDFTSGREATLVDIASWRGAELQYILTSPQGGKQL